MRGRQFSEFLDSSLLATYNLFGLKEIIVDIQGLYKMPG